MKGLRFWSTFALICTVSLAASFLLSQGTDSEPFVILADFSHRFEQLFHQKKPAHDLTTSTSLPLRADKVTAERKSSSVVSTTPFSDHSYDDDAVCSRPPTKDRRETGSNLVYKWVDESGQTHLSDTAPGDHIATVIDMAGSKQDFTYEIIPDGSILPIDFEGQIYAGSKRIYDTWHFFLGEEKLRQAHIRLRLIGGQGRFVAFQTTAWPNSKPSNGFYSAAKNEAYVNYDPQNPERAIHTSFHEISHIITTSHLGPTPPWLTEGLAEYFEMMDVEGQAGTIHVNRSHLHLLQEHRVPPLGQLLSIDRSIWNGEQRDLYYASSWSLIHYLMEDAPGIYALKKAIEEAHSHFCTQFSIKDALDSAYPGGLPRLELDWRKWLAVQRQDQLGEINAEAFEVVSL